MTEHLFSGQVNRWLYRRKKEWIQRFDLDIRQGDNSPAEFKGYGRQVLLDSRSFVAQAKLGPAIIYSRLVPSQVASGLSVNTALSERQRVQWDEPSLPIKQVDWFLDPTLPPVGPEGLAAFVNELQPFERSGWGPEDPYFDGAAALGVDWMTARVVAFSREGRFELLLWMASPYFESHYSQVSRLLTHLDREGFIANESELEIERAGMIRPHLVMDEIFEIGQTSTMDQEAYQRHLQF